MLGRDLEADLLIAQVPYDAGCALRIPYHQRYYRVLAGQRLQAQVDKSAPEAVGHDAQVREERVPLATVDDLNGSKGSCGLRRRDGIRIDVEWRRLAQEPDDRRT